VALSETTAQAEAKTAENLRGKSPAPRTDTAAHLSLETPIIMRKKHLRRKRRSANRAEQRMSTIRSGPRAPAFQRKWKNGDLSLSQKRKSPLNWAVPSLWKQPCAEFHAAMPHVKTRIIFIISRGEKQQRILKTHDHKDARAEETTVQTTNTSGQSMSEKFTCLNNSSAALYIFYNLFYCSNLPYIKLAAPTYSSISRHQILSTMLLEEKTYN